MNQRRMSIHSTRFFMALVVALLPIVLTQCGNGHAVFCAGPCGPVVGAPEFLYVTSASHGGEILSFPIDRNSGNLGASTSVPGPMMASGIAASQNQFLYVADAERNVIQALTIDQSNGTLTVIPGSPFPAATQASFPPLWLVAGPAVYTTAQDGITGFTIAANGVLSTIVGSPYAGGFSGQAVLAETNTSPSNTFLYATNSLDPNGTISAFQIVAPASGILTPVPGNFATGASTGPGAIVFAGASPSPFIFVALNNTKQIAGFSMDSSTGALSPVAGSPFATAFTPSFLALNGEQNFLYVLDSLDGEISIFGIASNGMLTSVSGTSVNLGGRPGGMAITPDNFLYVTLPDSSMIAGFTINSTNGGLVPMTASPFAALQASLLSVVQIPAQ